MQLQKFEHACVRITSDAAVLVIDPGKWTSREALDGVDAVLFTHEHLDHFDKESLADALSKRPSVQVFTHQAVAEKLDALAGVVTTVASGDTFTAAGFRVKAFGGWHAPIHPEVTRVPNLGYLIEDILYHPGDSFDVPEGAEVDTLFVPVAGPWLKISESVDFVRAVRPRRAFALHDALLSELGGQVTDNNMAMLAGCEYARLRPGETVRLR